MSKEISYGYNHVRNYLAYDWGKGNRKIGAVNGGSDTNALLGNPSAGVVRTEVEVSWKERMICNEDGAVEQQGGLDQQSTSGWRWLWPDKYTCRWISTEQHNCEGSEMNPTAPWLEAYTGIRLDRWLQKTELRLCISLRRWRALARIGLQILLCFLDM